MAVGWGNKTWGEETWGDLSNATASPNGIQSNINVLGENRIPYSENLNGWGQNVNYTITSNLTSPNGTVAQSLQQAVTSSQLTNPIQPKPDNNEEITYSFYAKNVVSGFLRVIIIQGSTSVFFGGWWDMANGVWGTTASTGTASITSTTSTAVGNGWYRVSITGKASSWTDCNVWHYLTDSDLSTVRSTTPVVGLWGCQVESGTSATNYKFTDTTRISSSLTTQANADVDVTGSQLTFTNAGAVAGASADVSVTGIQANLSIGEEDIARGIQQDVTGSQLTTTPGAVTIDDNFLIGSGWGRDSWGSMVWGDAYSAQTGSVSATISVGAVAEITAGASASPTGQELTATPGQITMTGDANIDVTGIQATLSVGQIQGLSVVGSQMTISTQTVDIEAGGNVSVNPIEDNLDSFIGSVTLDIGVTAGVTGSELTSSIGDETVTADGNVDITGQELTSTIGDETVVADGNVSVTGLELTSSIGEETVTADANVTVTGIELTSSIGDVEQNTIYDVTGVEMTLFLGEETAVANADVDVTGIELTSSIGSTNITAWQEVNPGVSNVWTEVDLAA